MNNGFKISILSWLLHHANRSGTNDKGFYLIKDKLLNKYGQYICNDIQFIRGKICYSCGGTGCVDNGDVYDADCCWNCNGTGWYKRPVWNILKKIRFGKYTFHKPYQKLYKKPITIPNIKGYIQHNRSKYSGFAITVLFLLYERGYIKRYWKGNGVAWRMPWWRPIEEKITHWMPIPKPPENRDG